MPTYDYKCKRCGFRFEAFQSILAEPIRNCPRCQEGIVERLITGGGGLIFKGSGFYETDYKKKTDGKGHKTSTVKRAESGSTKEKAAVGENPAADKE